MNSPSPRAPDVRETMATALSKGPNVPRTISTAPADDGTFPTLWLAATRGSQHSQEIAIAMIVNAMAEGSGEYRGRINGRCNATVPPRLAWAEPAPRASYRRAAGGSQARSVHV